MGILELAAGALTAYGQSKANKQGSSVNENSTTSGITNGEVNATEVGKQSVKANNTTTTAADTKSVDKNTTKGTNNSTSSGQSFTGTESTSTDQGVLSGFNNSNTMNTNSGVSGQTMTGTDQSSVTGVTTGFDSAIMQQLNGLLGGQIGGGGFQNAQDSIAQQMAQVNGRTTNFDPQAYAASVAGQAGARLQGDLEGQINGLMAATGGTTTGNSMAALLGNRMRNDTAAELAGIESAARMQGEDLLAKQQASQTEQVTSLSSAANSGLLGLIQSLNGAQQSTSQSTVAANTQAVQGFEESTGSSVLSGTTGQTSSNTNVTGSQTKTQENSATAGESSTKSVDKSTTSTDTKSVEKNRQVSKVNNKTNTVSTGTSLEERIANAKSSGDKSLLDSLLGQMDSAITKS